MCNDGDAPNVVMRTDPPCRALDLAAGHLGGAKHAVTLSRLGHLGIAIGRTEAEKIQSPYVETALTQFVAPRTAIEAVSDRKTRSERAAVHIQHDLCPRRWLLW